MSSIPISKKSMTFETVFFFLVSLGVQSWSSSASTKPGCQSRCGEIEISYPFGIGKKCSHDGYYFDVYCNTSSHPPKLYIQQPYHMEVVNFSADHSQIHVKNWTEQWGFFCYGMNYQKAIHLKFSDSPYTLSNANHITAFGCDDLISIEQYSHLTRTWSVDTCLTYCTGRYFSEGSCPGPGRGCCETSIPENYNYLFVRQYDMHSNWNRYSKYRNCSFAFVGGPAIDKIKNFTFNLSQLDNQTEFLLHNRDYFRDHPYFMSLVLDWRLLISSNSNSNCTNSPPTSILCQNNSQCVDFDASAGGYQCRCKMGYEGNPYLTPGCDDINECHINNPCTEYGYCTNTPGSYNCSCPRGYYGEGKKNGTGCSLLPTSHSKLPIEVGLGTGLGTLIILSTCLWLYNLHQKRKKLKCKKEVFKLRLMQQGVLETLQIFTAKELEKATDQFSKSRELGKGGEGTVYKGMLSDGKIVAIKKSNSEDEKNVELFMNEVIILSQINHKNVVKLLGCCIETQVPLLVYEFVSNGTLYDHLHDENNEFPITWNLRLKIATEVAGALAYLHSATCHSIYHRDIKSRNILLDEKYVPKVSDFGTSLSIQDDQTHVTTQVIGTYGYIDPQYFCLSQFTEKSDVYSFGVVLVELLTTKKPTRSHVVQEDMGLAARFLLCMEEGNIETILDSRVLEQAAGKKEELISVATLAQRCLNLNGKERPTMKEVAITLESIRISQTPSTPNTFAQVHLLKSMLVSDDDYTWTSTSNSTIPSLDTCPLKIHTV